MEPELVCGVEPELEDAELGGVAVEDDVGAGAAEGALDMSGLGFAVAWLAAVEDEAAEEADEMPQDSAAETSAEESEEA